MSPESLLRTDRGALVKLCVLLLLVGGCASSPTLRSSLPVEDAVQANTVQVDAAELPETDLPLEIRVIGEHNDGEYIHVLGEIRSSTPWAYKDIAIRMSGLNAGETVRELTVPLVSALVSKTEAALVTAALLPDKPTKFSVSLAVQGIRDYQIEVLWGAEAQGILLDSSKNRDLGLVLRKLRIERHEGSCSRRPCEAVFRVMGDLYNSADITLRKAVLGIGFLSVKTPGLDMKNRIPDNEELINISDLDLLPGASRPFKIVIDRAVPESLARKISPSLRVVSYE